MGLANSKSLVVEPMPEEDRAAKDTERGVPVSSKRRRPRFEECFGLDESQSRSTESTQGSPEIDMYPSKSTRDDRRHSQGGGTPFRPRWLRRQISLPHHTTAPGTTKEDSLPPSYLEFQPHNDVTNDDTVPSLDVPDSASGKTAPVPVHSKPLVRGESDDCSEQPEARMDELQRMYDLRTWDMYLRITEARKNKPSSSSTMIPHGREVSTDYDYYTPEDALEDPDHHPPADVSQSAEDMIFGDLE